MYGKNWALFPVSFEQQIISLTKRNICDVKAND